jgi:hemoglobin
MKNDLIGKDDIKLLVDQFYDKAKKDELLGKVFNEIFQVNWEHHLPRMYSFWEFMLFQTGEYRGAPFDIHVEVNKKATLTPLLFDTWVQLFCESVDELFEGNNAATIKLKAENIKKVWSYKFEYINKETID